MIPGRYQTAGAVLTNPALGSGFLSPTEVDALFARLEERVAEMIVKGPQADDDGWFWLMLDGLDGEGS